MPVLVALFASLCWGAADFLGGTLSKKYAAWAVAGGGQIVGLVALLIASPLLGGLQWSVGTVLWGFAAGACAFTALTLMYSALAQGTMGVISPIIAMSAVIPVIVGLVSGDPLTTVHLIGMVLCLVGIVTVTIEGKSRDTTGRSSKKPIVMAIFSSIAFGASLALLAKGSEAAPLTATVSMRMAAACGALILVIFTRSVGGLNKSAGWVLLGLGALDAAAYLSFGWASAAGSLSSVSVLSALYPVETAVLAFIIHRERLKWWQVGGVVIAFVGVAALAM